MCSSSIPKTFAISGVKSDGSDSGYLRFRSFQENGGIKYALTFVKSKKQSSRFLNFDNAKTTAQEFMKKYSLVEMKITDLTSGKVYNVKEPKKVQE